MIKRPKQVERSQKSYLSNEKYQDYAENQFKTIYDYLDYLTVKVEGNILYENQSGTNGNINFDDVIEEENEIEIIYKTRDYHKSSGKIPFKNGMKVALDFQYLADNTAHTSVGKLITVNREGITVVNEQSQVIWNIQGYIPSIATTSDIYITKVIVYK